MSDDKIGFPESVSLAVSGMVGGGIFAVLGVVAAAAGPAAWLAFLASGILALCAGYSFVRLLALTDDEGGPIRQIEVLTGRRWVAGLTGWLFTFGYVGTMAMYAFAFGSYALELVGVHTAWGLPLRPLVSVGGVALFVGLNALGARASGRTEDALVALKVLILLVFGVGGLYFGYTHDSLQSGFGVLNVGAMTAAAISFVAFEGWELLTFDLDSIRDPRATVKKAIYVSIAATTGLYVVVAVVTTNLVPTSAIRASPETALAVAARPFLGETGFVLIAVAAVLSTASALNATLFSAARLTQEIADTTHSGEGSPSTGLHRAGLAQGSSGGVAGDDRSGTSTMRSLLVLGVLTAILTAYGGLESITSFASGAFITIFGGVSALAFLHRDGPVNGVVPAVGALGAGAGLVALFWHLHSTSPSVLVTVAVIWAVVLAVYWLPRRR